MALTPAEQLELDDLDLKATGLTADESQELADLDRRAAVGGGGVAALTEREERRADLMEVILREDFEDIVTQSNIAKELLVSLEDPGDFRMQGENRMMLSALFDISLEDAIFLEPGIIKELYGEPIEKLSNAVINRNLKGDIKNALKETPLNLMIGTIGLTASMLETIKRRSVQLAGGGVFDDEALLRQFEAVTPALRPGRGSFREPDDANNYLFDGEKIDFIRPDNAFGANLARRSLEELRSPLGRPEDVQLPGAIAAEAVGLVTRIPDIGAKILRSKQTALQKQQDIATMANAPITKLMRTTVQSGVPSVGAAIGISLLTGNPMVGLVMLGESEGGAAFQTQLDAGGSVRKALIIGELSEAAEIGGEMLVFPKVVRGLSEGISIRKALTLIAENATQEGVTGFNQTFLEVFGTETTEGTDKLLAAKKAFVAGYKAIPESAFVGGAVGGTAGVAGVAVDVGRTILSKTTADQVVAQVEADIIAEDTAAVQPSPQPEPDDKGVKPEIPTAGRGAGAEAQEAAEGVAAEKARLEGLSYRDIQKEARAAGIKANQKKVDLIDQIAERVQAPTEAAQLARASGITGTPTRAQQRNLDALKEFPEADVVEGTTRVRMRNAKGTTFQIPAGQIQQKLDDGLTLAPKEAAPPKRTPAEHRRDEVERRLRAGEEVAPDVREEFADLVAEIEGPAEPIAAKPDDAAVRGLREFSKNTTPSKAADIIISAAEKMGLQTTRKVVARTGSAYFEIDNPQTDDLITVRVATHEVNAALRRDADLMIFVGEQGAGIFPEEGLGNAFEELEKISGKELPPATKGFVTKQTSKAKMLLEKERAKKALRESEFEETALVFETEDTAALVEAVRNAINHTKQTPASTALREKLNLSVFELRPFAVKMGIVDRLGNPITQPPTEAKTFEDKMAERKAKAKGGLNTFERFALKEELKQLREKIDEDTLAVLEGRSKETSGGWNYNQIVEGPGANIHRYIEITKALKAQLPAEAKVEKAIPIISNPEIAKAVGITKPDILSGVETGKPVSVDVVRGSGRATKGEIYASGEGEPAFGTGRYSAIDETFAKHFGPEIEKLTIQLNNPFVLTNDEQLAALVGRPIPRDGEPRKKFLREARQKIEEMGHDGIIINIPVFGDVDTTGKSAKRLVEISGATQTIEFQPPTEAKPAPDTIERIAKKFRDQGNTVFLSEDEGDIIIDTIIIPKDKRKQGIGSQIMQDIIDFADKTGRRVLVSPGQKDDFQGTTSRARLVKFYKRFGFVENKGRNKDFTLRKAMFRDPKGLPSPAEDIVATIPGTEIEFDEVLSGFDGKNTLVLFRKGGEAVHQFIVRDAGIAAQQVKDFQTVLTEGGAIEATSEGGLVEPLSTTQVEKSVKPRVISQEAFDAARKRLNDPAKLRTGLSFEDVKDMTTIGAFLFESGVRDLADWSAEMIERMGDFVKPHLRDIYRRVVQQEVREGREADIGTETLQEFADEKWAARTLVRKEKGLRVITPEKREAPQKGAAGLEPDIPFLDRPTRAEQAVIDAKKFNADIAAHQAQVRGEEGVVRIETEQVDDITEPFGKTMGAEWYEKNSRVYRETILEKGSDFIRGIIKGIAKVFGVTSTRINNISPEIFRRLRRHEFNVMTRTTEQTKRIEPFLKATRKLSRKQLNQFDLAAKNSDAAKMTEIAAEHGFTKELAEVRKVLDELYNQGNAVGLAIDYRRQYMPRIVSKTRKFLEFFQGRDDWSIIRTAIENKEEARGRVLTETERAATVNTLLRGYQTSALTLTAPGAAKERTVQEIDSEINVFYADFRDSLTKYIQVMNEKIAAREFFGRQSVEITKLRARESALRTRLGKLATRQGRQKKTDVDKEIRLGFLTASLPVHISRATEELGEVIKKLERVGADDLSNTVGQYVLELVVNEEIKPSQEKELRDLLMGRFDPKPAGEVVGGVIIPLTYIDVLSQFTNAITQMEEFALAFYRSPVGFIPAATKAILNLSEITLQDIGVTTISEDFSDADSRKVLSTILSITGFKKFDALAKQTFINAALKQLQDQSKKQGMTFNDRLKRVFGAETDQVVKDLQAGEITEDVKLLIFNNLLDIQPLSKSEVPEAYNRAGNLRLLYTLKQFTIKQFDFVRTEALADMRNPKGDPARFMRGFGRLMWLGFSLALFGAGRDRLVDFLTGRPFDLSDSVIDTFLRRLFFSRFQYGKAMREGIGRAFLEGFIPPTKTIDVITKDIKKVSKGDEDGLDIWRSVPIVGELYYWWFGRGREKAAREHKKAEREQVRRRPLSTKRGSLPKRRR